tara:strand:+ start:26 stop:535 length:510 start_codon:yes stop_codon:yes gene_type:complete
MVVAETLAGVALVNSAVKGIKAVIGTCKDVSEVADQIDSIFQGRKEIKQQSHPIASKWDSFLGKTLGASADRFSLGAVAKATIEEKLVEEQINSVRLMINRRFGPDVWSEILENRRLKIEEHKIAVNKENHKKRKQTEKLLKMLETVGGILLIVVVIGGVAAYIYWAKR